MTLFLKLLVVCAIELDLDVPATTSAKVLCVRVRGADVDGDDSEDAGPKSVRKGVGDEGNGGDVGNVGGATGGTAL
ncbi:hypothetical protein J6590_014509 [Homalodisca vitripennis]|nr:hypothetical protein J6590_014509 [Homalodisca vitripennis]